MLATLEDFDARIHVLERELAALKTKRNDLLPMYRLPPEIVADVFKLVQHGCQSIDEIRPWDTYNIRWCDIMLVCRHFREVAVRTAGLWNVLDYNTYPSDWIDLCIARSCNLPLSIRDTSGHALEHIQRAWLLEINGAAVTTNILTSLPPTLHALQISDALDEMDRGEAFCITKSMIRTDLMVAYLGLSSFLALEDIPAFISLNRLDLDSVFVNKGLDGLVQVLRQVGRIQILCLRNLDFTGGSTEFSGENAVVSLPCLHSLFVADTPRLVWTYLRALPLPTITLGISVTNMTAAADHGHETHAAILDTWFRFVRSVPNSASLAQGTLMHEHANLIQIRLGDGKKIGHLREFCSEGPTRFCEFRFQGSLIDHPATPYITTLHLVLSRELGALSRNREITYAHQLRNLQCLIFEGLRRGDVDSHLMAAIQACIAERGTSLQQIRFVECHESMKTFAEELQQGGRVATIDWVYSDAADHSDSGSTPSW
jgi:hypothetical protein